jgi:hypothetical protein
LLSNHLESIRKLSRSPKAFQVRNPIPSTRREIRAKADKSQSRIMASSSDIERTEETSSELYDLPALPNKAPCFAQTEQEVDSFTLFPKLPIELRLKIWRYTFPRGRYINLDDHDEFALYSSYQPTDHATDELKKEPLLPVTLSVNKESREETLKHYIIAFLELLCTGGIFRQRTFCYNMSLDTAFIGCHAMVPPNLYVLSFRRA